MKRKVLSLLLTLALCLSLVPLTAVSVHAAGSVETPAASDNAVRIYGDRGSGFELLSELYFEDSVTEQSIMIDQPITALRIVKGVCYELNLDQLTLEGVCPAGYERKLSAADNDLIEIEDSEDFALCGSGELIIAGRAPVELLGENCSFKFPSINRGPIGPRSYYFSYVPGSNLGSFSDGDVLVVPDEAYLFASVMCYPDSGHPDAPTDIYVADDGETLYIFFEAFMDNTFDHGKDFAAVHVKIGDAIKTYKVHTTEENEYGRWWFGYTDSSDVYDWEHMCYVVEAPLADLEVESGILEIAFEYYGTAGYQGKELLMLGIGDVFMVADTQSQAWYVNPAEYYPDADLLPAPGETLNADGGNTATGDWWLTNEDGDFTLTLNGAKLDSRSEVRNKWDSVNRFAPLYTEGNLTIELVEGTINTIEFNDPSRSDDRGLEANCEELIIQGKGTLNVSAEWCPIEVNNLLTIQNGAIVNASISHTHTSYDSGSWNYYALYSYALTVDNATVKANSVVTVPAGSSSEVHSIGIYIGHSGYKLTVKNSSLVEAFATGGNDIGGNHAILWYGEDARLVLEGIAETILEGDDADSSTEVDELTTQKLSYSAASKPYVKLKTVGPYILTYDANGGSGTMDSETYTSGAAITLKACGFTAPSGKQFRIWEIDGTEYEVGDGPIATADMTAKALWEDSAAPAPSGGGGGATTYPVTPAEAENGKITVSPKNAAKGDTVTVTVTPDEGYELDKLIVKDKDGNEIEVTEKDGKYTFTMPASEVSIEPTFKEAEDLPGDGFPFVDVPEDAYFRKPVEWAVEKGITSGVSEDKYGPELSCTRAQVVTFLWITCGSEDAGTETGFDDVDVDAYYDKAVAWAVEKGITAGTSGNEFSPEMTITRAQFVTMLWAAKGKPEPDGEMPFKDVPEDAYYAKAVAWAYANDITAGKSADSFAPDDPCTRGQIMTFLYNAYGE